MCQVELHVVDEIMIEKIGHPVSSGELMNIKILIKVSMLCAHMSCLHLSSLILLSRLYQGS